MFDGFPRTLPQAEQLDRILERKGFGKPIVVDFRVDEGELLRRLSGRWTCSVGEKFTIFTMPLRRRRAFATPMAAVLVQRPDDRPEVVKERLAAYDRQTKPLADYYRRRGVLDTVDAAARVEDVGRALGEIFRRAEGRDGHL